MERRLPRALILCMFILYYLLIPFSLRAAEITEDTTTSPPILITEVAAFEPEGLEWIEIYNASDKPINLTQWKLLEEGAKHTIKATTNTPELPAGYFAIIADDADKILAAHPTSTVLIYDSSWGTLKENGEEIALIAPDGTVYERFTYPAQLQGSSERIDLTKSPQNPANWFVREEGSRFGLPYEEPITLPEPQDVIPTPETTSSPEPTEPPILSTTTTSTPDLPPIFTVRISEVVVDPLDDEPEWVELFFAQGDSAELRGWTLSDAKSVIATVTSSVALTSSTPFAVVNIEGNKLNNTGDSIILKNAAGALVHELSYTQDTAPKEGESLAFDEITQQYKRTTTPTKDAPNTISAPIIRQANNPTANALPAAARNIEETTHTQNTPAIAVSSSPATAIERQVRINELYPNPKGNDATEEFIELFNPTSSIIPLAQWRMSDNQKKSYTFPAWAAIEPRSYFLLPRTQTQIALDNNGLETVSLVHPSGEIISTLSYEGAQEALSYLFDETQQRWLWSTMVTRGSANIFSRPNQTPIPRIDAPKKTYTGHVVYLDGAESSDADDDALTFLWTLPDTTTSTSQTIHHIFTTPGIHRVYLIVTDNQGANVSVHHDITVESPPLLTQSATKDRPPTKKSSQSAPAAHASPPLAKPQKPKSAPAPVSTSLTKIAELQPGSNVRVRGTITALPGVLGSQFFYIGNPGIQIYMYSKKFPSLHTGDVVEVTGVLTSSGEELRIKVKDASAIRTVQTEQPIEPHFIHISEITRERYSWLVETKGTVSDKTSNALIIDDGTEELPILVKTPLPKEITPGALIAVTGIVRPKGPNRALYARTDADIRLIEKPKEPPAMLTMAGAAPHNPNPSSFFTSALGRMSALTLLGLLLYYCFLRFNRKNGQDEPIPSLALLPQPVIVREPTPDEITELKKMHREFRNKKFF